MELMTVGEDREDEDDEVITEKIETDTRPTK